MPPLIGRRWRGATRAADAETYLRYMERTGLAAFAATPGNRGSLTLRRIVADRAEFVIISFWDSMDAVRAFAGDEPERAVFYPEDERFLVDRDLDVGHYEVVAGTGIRE